MIYRPLGLATALALAMTQTACEPGGDNIAATNDAAAIDNATADNAMANATDMANATTATNAAEPATENMTTAAPPAATAAPATPDYVVNAALSDMYEIQSSRIAQDKARSADVKSFAQRMITDHTATTAKLKETLPKARVTTIPPTALDARRQALIQQLEAAAPAGFDALYRQQQLAAHQEALQLHQSYAAGGDNPALVELASQTAPKVRMHLEMLQKMAP